MKYLDRTKFLGGTDAGAVLGVSPYKTPMRLWLEKTGREPPELDDDDDSRRRKARGVKLEPFIREMTIEKLIEQGHEVEVLEVNERYTDPVHSFLSCEIDFGLRIDGHRWNVDAKSVDRRARQRWGEVGTDEVPIEYAAQFMHGMMIHPARPERTLVAALKGFDDVDLYEVRRDEVTIEAMRAKLVDFWVNHVERDVPPDPVKFADMRALFKTDNGNRIEATDEVVELVDGLRSTQAKIKDLERQEENIKFFLARFMGEHSVITRGPRDLLTWQVQEWKRFDVKAFEREHPDWYAMFTRRNPTRVMRFAAKRSK